MQTPILHHGKHNTKNITVRLQFYVRITGNFWTTTSKRKVFVMKRIAIWRAVSSLPQAKKISLDDQLDQALAVVKRHDAHLVADLEVHGESRSIILFEDACERIEAYSRLKGLIDDRAIDVLIYLDVSRLGRMAALVLAIAELCTRAGILLYELDNPPASLEFKAQYDEPLFCNLNISTGDQWSINGSTNAKIQTGAGS